MRLALRLRKPGRDPKTAETIESRSMPEPNSGCWIWLWANKPTYGRTTFSDSPKVVQAHRASWEIYRGPIPPGLVIMHHCDNKRCVNPAHLQPATYSENMLDASRKGFFRHRRNWRHSHTACEQGHPYPEVPKRHRGNRGRRCLVCEKLRVR